MNSLRRLLNEGQSYWLDFIRRDLLTSGELKRMIEADGLRGMTSNPTIFEKAFASGHDYDASFKKAAPKAKSVEDLFEIIAAEDIQKAADLLKPVYKSSGGTDGFVSLEVSPYLASDTRRTLEAARHLWKKVRRPNVMIKIPGTPAGIPAIQAAVADGLNINITLLFSIENYKQVMEAYLSGLETRLKKGKPIRNVASVASFFVSRVDTVVDKQLDKIIAGGGSDARAAQALLHKTAIANAKLAYAYFQDVSRSDRWKKLAAKGAQPQRLLWASTGTKDARLSDVIYVEELIGPHTVNTMPPQTAEAFKEHGRVSPTLNVGVDEARKNIQQLRRFGIDLAEVTTRLQEDGVQSFAQSYEELMQVVGAKWAMVEGGKSSPVAFGLRSYKKAFENAVSRMKSENWVARIWGKDAAFWKSEEDHQRIIGNSLGWLNVMKTVRQNLFRLDAITEDIKKQKFSHTLLLGMGGSSLAPEVLRLTFGRTSGYPDFAILDSTEPASVLERRRRSKPEKTLYVVASKSGATAEPNAFLATFFDEISKKSNHPGDNFIAITDPGTLMERIAVEKKFRHVMVNPADIGGRFSAMSYFGMLPAALMGLPVSVLLDRCERMAAACSPKAPLDANPGARLGAALGTLAKQGRDKVTFFLSKDIRSFAGWAEQLIAESTGKEGKGILPVESEEIQSPKSYGADRVFVSVRTGASRDPGLVKKLKALEKAGHPVIWITLKDKWDLAGQFFLWEFATAVAGRFLDINPFDQPNVQESKDLTKEYLDAFKQDGCLSMGEYQFEKHGIFLSGKLDPATPPCLRHHLRRFLADAKKGDYVALLAYIRRDALHEKKLQAIRHALLQHTGLATTLGYGPRFLHSTGQLHKGGGNNGLFIQILADDPDDLAIPGDPFTFSILKNAQALGDTNALIKRGRRVVRLRLSRLEEGLDLLAAITPKIGSDKSGCE